jgi:SAM-dependent methyltransferase
MAIVERIRNTNGDSASLSNQLIKCNVDPGLVPEPLASWEDEFASLIAEARRSGVDPNDIGDREWGTDRVSYGLEEYYLPAARGARVVELGPGSGRLIRHLVKTVEYLTVVDLSDFRLQRSREYLSEHANYEVHNIAGAEMPMGP